MPRIQVRIRPQTSKCVIHLGQRILTQSGGIARENLGENSKRIALISNKKVFGLYGPQVQTSLEASGFSVSRWLMGEGERFKSLGSAERAVNFLHEANLDRSDGVVALGGGVVGDLAGFASAIYLRGIPFIQIPTTLMAQVDSSIGGKTAVNLPSGKNLIGSFHQPRAVIIDVETLATLPSRELTSGWYETIKQGAVSSRKLFNETTDFLRNFDPEKSWISSTLIQLIAAHLSFKASIVASDEREDVSRRDGRSRKILNFGHTIAHALETITNYRRFRHGEAVGHGMLAAGALSKNLGLLKESELELLCEGVRLCGTLPPAEDLDPESILSAINHDKKRSGGELQWVLLEGIGRSRIVKEKEISPRLIKQSWREALIKRGERQ
ncbi:MAG TPA: 3-dehydroquinate synthase [Pyrinomonadaceae bacterium]|nr:3-dehydroquinate synthase [Pyrinomonadaceae bacterium]